MFQICFYFHPYIRWEMIPPFDFSKQTQSSLLISTLQDVHGILQRGSECGSEAVEGQRLRCQTVGGVGFTKGGTLYIGQDQRNRLRGLKKHKPRAQKRQTDRHFIPNSLET